MSDVMFCRSCLAIATDSRLHNLNDGLMEVFRSLTGLPLKSENTSHLFCTDCKNVLSKISIFRKKSLTVETLMNDLVTAGVEINDKCLTLINKDTKCSNTRISQVHTINCCSTCDTNNYEQNQAYNTIYSESIPKDKKHDILSQRYIIAYDEKLFVLEELNVDQNDADDNFNDETVKEEMDFTTGDDGGTLHVFANESRNFTNETVGETEKTMQLQAFNPKNRFQCDLCSYTFSQRYILVNHLKNCNKKKDSLSSSNHAKSFKCNICDNSFTDITSLDQHTIFHTESFVCNYCNKVFSSKLDLIKHIKKHTRKMCAYCDKPFASTSELKRHIRTHQKRPYECKLCKRTHMTNSHLLRHIRVHKKNYAYIICEFCSKSFTAKSIYERHLRTHTGSKPFKCDVCSKSFSLKAHMKRHFRIHTGEKRHYECKFCERTYMTNNHLLRHIRVHTKDCAYFICEFCSKSFTAKSKYENHLRTHTGSKPFKCDVCSKSFSREANMKRHFRIHTGEKRHYECKFCERTYMTNNHLHTHIIRVHTKDCAYFICEFCSKSFANKYAYESHLRSHTGSKPYKCDVCGKSFSQKFSMKRHFMIHSGEKPHKCKICNRTFRTNTNLKRHLNVHLGEDR